MSTVRWWLRRFHFLSTRQRLTCTWLPPSALPWQAQTVREPASTASDMQARLAGDPDQAAQVGERAPPAVAYDADAGAVALGDQQPAAGRLLDVPRVREPAGDGADLEARRPGGRWSCGRRSCRRADVRDGRRQPDEQATGEGGDRQGQRGGAEAVAHPGDASPAGVRAPPGAASRGGVPEALVEPAHRVVAVLGPGVDLADPVLRGPREGDQLEVDRQPAAAPVAA